MRGELEQDGLADAIRTVDLGRLSGGSGGDQLELALAPEDFDGERRSPRDRQLAQLRHRSLADMQHRHLRAARRLDDVVVADHELALADVADVDLDVRADRLGHPRLL